MRQPGITTFENLSRLLGTKKGPEQKFEKPDPVKRANAAQKWWDLERDKNDRNIMLLFGESRKQIAGWGNAMGKVNALYDENAEQLMKATGDIMNQISDTTGMNTYRFGDDSMKVVSMVNADASKAFGDMTNLQVRDSYNREPDNPQDYTSPKYQWLNQDVADKFIGRSVQLLADTEEGDDPGKYVWPEKYKNLSDQQKRNILSLVTGDRNEGTNTASMGIGIINDKDVMTTLVSLDGNKVRIGLATRDASSNQIAFETGERLSMAATDFGSLWTNSADAKNWKNLMDSGKATEEQMKQFGIYQLGRAAQTYKHLEEAWKIRDTVVSNINALHSAIYEVDDKDKRNFLKDMLVEMEDFAEDQGFHVSQQHFQDYSLEKVNTSPPSALNEIRSKNEKDRREKNLSEIAGTLYKLSAFHSGSKQIIGPAYGVGEYALAPEDEIELLQKIIDDDDYPASRSQGDKEAYVLQKVKEFAAERDTGPPASNEPSQANLDRLYPGSQIGKFLDYRQGLSRERKDNPMFEYLYRGDIPASSMVREEEEDTGKRKPRKSERQTRATSPTNPSIP